MSNLPPDIIAEIICRLPAKKLLCCRCVSRSWRSLIDGPNFIKLHLKHSIETSSNLSIILKNSDLYSIGFDSMDRAKVLEHPLMCYNHGIKVLGCCNGLLCICNIVDDMALWNPSTRKHHVVPFLPIELKRYFGMCSCKVHVFGFGYDSINDDYKVVRIAQFGGVDRDSFESEVKVYSLRSNSWWRIGDMPYRIHYPGVNGVFACGALHWIVSQNPEPDMANIIVALDLGVEDYREVQQPECMDKNYSILNVGNLGGCLCLVVTFDRERVDVWVMKEYRFKESWNKLFSVAWEEMIGIPMSLKPLAYSSSGNEVLMGRDNINLWWYDLRTKKVKDVWIQGMPFMFQAEICVGSLVPLDLNRRFGGKLQHEHETKNTKKRDDFLSEGFKLVL